ncbi:MAG: hypothetical protein PW843_08680 [Azospirillaceae bacterium]|nr:hypothetical protein [Azospirillaceae bacterium]
MRMHLFAATLLATGLIGGVAAAQTNDPNEAIPQPEANAPPPAPVGDEGAIGPATTTTSYSSSSYESNTVTVRPRSYMSTGTGKVQTAMKPGDTVPKPVCLPDSNTTPHVWAAPVVFGMPQARGNLHGIDTWVEDRGGNWVVKSTMVAGEGDAPVSDQGQGGWVEISTMCATPDVPDSTHAGSAQTAMN